MTGRYAGICLALVAALTLPACSSGDAEPPEPSPSVTATPSPTPATTKAPAEPRLPAAAKKPTRAGAEAFFYHFWDVVNYSYRLSDPAPVRKVSQSSCKFCQGLLSELKAAQDAGERFSGGQITVNAAVAAPGSALEGIVINAISDQAIGRRIAADGSVVRVYPRQKNVRIDCEVRWNGNHWRMAGVDILDEGKP